MFRPTSAGHLLKLQALLGCCPFLFGSHVFSENIWLKQKKNIPVAFAMAEHRIPMGTPPGNPMAIILRPFVEPRIASGSPRQSYQLDGRSDTPLPW